MTFYTAINAMGRTFNPTWLTGPIFDKELRIASRRKRNYLLRFIYLMLLTFFVALTWWRVVDFNPTGNTAYGVSRMAEVGKAVVTAIIWFQFVAAQLIAISTLSNAIGEEINSRTLGVLMTTPITSFQIVFGKLSSKLLHVFLALSYLEIPKVNLLGAIALVAALGEHHRCLPSKRTAKQ